MKEMRESVVELVGDMVLLWCGREDREIMQRRMRVRLEVRVVMIRSRHSETRFSRISGFVYLWRQTSEELVRMLMLM